jgi:hypothetical protein
VDDGDRLRLDYGETTQLLRSLTDVRFKLLAFVPTIAGAAVAFVGHPQPAAGLLAVGALGLVATVGVLLYELRNSQIHDEALRRAAVLEQRLGLRSSADPERPGGLYSERPAADLDVLGVTVSRDRALAFVYGAALAGWTYLTAWGALKALHVHKARTLGGVIAIVVAVLVIGVLEQVRPRAGSLSSSDTSG